VIYKQINFKQLKDMINSNKDILLLDVRSSDDFNIKKLKNSVNIPLQDLYHDIDMIEAFKDKVIIVYCYHGYRSVTACNILYDLGFRYLYNLKNGIDNEI
jgi:rhodanese-related sulfurtransferase